MTAHAFIAGVSGTMLTPQEREFLREADPWGLILFKRNIDSPEQVAGLTAAFRETVGRQAPILIDQEGGRVQRMGPPHWPTYPPGAVYGRVYDRDPAASTSTAYRLPMCRLPAPTP
jgi:beta-N-acetylhexosaminidase